MNVETVVLVDEEDQELGTMERSLAHQGKGKLHRAISVLLYRKQNQQIETLIQQRSRYKLLWPGIWTNTICTHPRQHEKEIDCAVRRLDEELGIKNAKKHLKFVLKFIYKARYDEKYIEHELDHVFLGEWDGKIQANPEEVRETKWINWQNLQKDINTNPSSYTPWFILMTKNPKISKFLNHG